MIRLKTARYGLFATVLAAVFSARAVHAAGGLEPQSLPGLTIDDAQAVTTGDWMSSTSIKPFVGESYIHDQDAAKGTRTVTFTFRVPETGDYHLLLSYGASGNRATNVPVKVTSQGGDTDLKLNQRNRPAWKTGFEPLGEFRFDDQTDGVVLIETTGTDGHVIVDAVRLIPVGQFASVATIEQSEVPVQTPAMAKTDKPAPPKQQAAPDFVRPPISTAFVQITPEELDQLLANAGADGEDKAGSDAGDVPPVDDIRFFRRLALDLIGRQPSFEEYRQFLADQSSERRDQAIERYLASTQFGVNWANYWSDVIGARQEEPQLTFLNYATLRTWLADGFNQSTGWDELVFRMLTAVGTVGDNPAGTFIGFHQGEQNRIAGEMSRIFMGVQIGCAQCHDHPFVDMPQETFHGMAAFFVRTKVKLPWNDSDDIEISSADKGEHRMPGSKENMVPTVFRGQPVESDLSDVDRRENLAYWMVSADNPFFARACVNHIQARLLGRGFFDPVDNMGEDAQALNESAHAALAGHLTASNFDLKSVFRVLLRTAAYQRADRFDQSLSTARFTGARPKKLRGDEVFASLVSAIELPNFTPPQEPASDDVRFPPPPKSTRDIINEAFSYDPTTRDELLTRTMDQAMLLMNNEQILQHINASPDSGTLLSKLVADEQDDSAVVDVLYARVLARSPSDRERDILRSHIQQSGDRGRAFEDILWSLLNSAEFTTRN